MDRVCYNCFKENPDHQSLHCPEPQKYTRCNTCRRVCVKPDDHFGICPNRTFISEYIVQTNTAQFGTLVADLKISTKAKLFLMDGPEPMDISTEFDPIQLDANYGLLIGYNKSLKYYQWFPQTNRRCVINVKDNSNNVRFSARLMSDVLVINKKIRIRNNGAIELRNDVPDNEISQAEVTFKVETDTAFKITIYAFHKNFSFEISQDGVRYLPPQWHSIECPICYDSMVGQEVKMLGGCMHMFCTVCILQTLNRSDLAKCPVCRAVFSEESLRSIYLYNN